MSTLPLARIPGLTTATGFGCLDYLSSNVLLPRPGNLRGGSSRLMRSATNSLGPGTILLTGNGSNWVPTQADAGRRGLRLHGAQGGARAPPADRHRPGGIRGHTPGPDGSRDLAQGRPDVARGVAGSRAEGDPPEGRCAAPAQEHVVGQRGLPSPARGPRGAARLDDPLPGRPQQHHPGARGGR